MASHRRTHRIAQRLVPRLKRHLYLIFAVLGLTLLVSVTLHWFLVFVPRLRAASEERVIALAQGWTHKVEQLLSQDTGEPLLRTQLEGMLPPLLNLKDSTTGRPIIHRIQVFFETEPLAELNLDYGTGDEDRCFVVENELRPYWAAYPIGRVRLYFERQLTEGLANQLAMTLLAVGAIITCIMVLAWLQVRKLVQWLREGEENLRAVFEAAPFPMMLQIAEEQDLCWANEAARGYLGLDGAGDGRLGGVLWEQLAQALPTQPGEGREIRLDEGEGAERWVLASVIPVRFYGIPGRLIGFADISLLKATQHELHAASITDPLTGLYNRRYLYQRLEQETESANRYGQPLSILLFDLDHFKRINDTLGHNVGDDVLVWVSGVLRSTLREVDIAGRHGGEEFLVILPQTDLAGGIGVAERLRAAIESIEWPVNGLRVTISGGVAQYSSGERVDEFVHRADCKLYEAKKSGRNRFCVAE